MSAAERLMTLAQAAEASGCSARTLRRAIDSGDLAAVRLGVSAKSDRIHPADLAAFWARRKTKPCQSPSVPTPGTIKSPSASVDERLARLLATGVTPTPKRTNASGSPPSKGLRLVASKKG